MFQDEARFGRISDTCYCWAPRPVRPMVRAMLTHQYTYAYGAVCPGDELREKYFHNQAFDSLDALEEQLIAGLRHLEQHPEVVKSISAWDWIINSVSNAN